MFEDYLTLQHMRNKREAEVDVDDEVGADGFSGDNSVGFEGEAAEDEEEEDEENEEDEEDEEEGEEE
ncbi:hypothetical protein CLOM_g15400 [Closterium sp. NIES-68]|nr:hypothetical protein CLOM_g15400 [Closterium sp. NIES-68]GJP65671.1 hypothetical protein CLOP_g22538 [Closterium sp. NIES-67]